MKQTRLMISGIVQGVGYRYFVRSNAQKIGLNGWVRNTSNGNVEAVLQGSQNQIEEMIALCRLGPAVSEVENIEVEIEEAEETFSDFTIR